MRRALLPTLTALLALGLPPLPAIAAFPGDSGRIAFERVFVQDGTRQRQVFSMNADGSDQRQLTWASPDADGAGDPAWAPQGNRIAYTVTSAGASDIWVMNADGSGQTNLTATPARSETAPFWSPDGLRIGFVRDDALLVMNADGTREMRVPTPAGAISSPAWSPEGDRIAFAAPDATNPLAQAIWTMNLDGSDARQVTSAGDAGLAGEDLHRAPAWSPDGTRIAFLDGQDFLDCTDDIVRIIAVDGSGGSQVHEGSCQMSDVAWSPDGGELAFTQYESDVFSEEREAERSVFRRAVDGTGFMRVTGPTPDTFDHELDWQPLPDRIGSACPSGGVPPTTFPDIAGSTHERAIVCAAWHGVTSGFAGGTYGPSETVTRGQMASFLARTLEAAGATLPPPGAEGFVDADGTVHGEAVTRLAAAGIVEGRPDGTYGPGVPVTRAQMATFLARTAEWHGGHSLPAVPDAFSDDNGSAHEHNINGMAAVGVTTGRSAGMFEPGNSVRRDQMASFLARLLNRFMDAGLGI